MVRKCPVCKKGTMANAGYVNVENKKTGRKRKVQVRRCKSCGYRTAAS